MPAIDPTGIHIDAQLVTSRGVFPLRVGGAQQSGQSFFEGEYASILDLPVVERANIDMNFGMNGKVSVDIYAPFEIARALLSSELFRVGNLLQVRAGYPASGIFLPWFSGVTGQPTFRVDPTEGLTATITGEGAAFTASRNSRSRVWEGRSYADIITEIADFSYNRWNLELPFEPASPSLFETRESVSQSNHSDWAFLYHLCRTAGCEAVLIYTPENETQPTLRIMSRGDMYSGTPNYTFVMFGQVDFISKFPLFNFETSGEGIWMPAGNAPIRYGDWNPDTQEETGGTVTQEDREAMVQRLHEETFAVGVSEEPQGTETTVAGLDEEGRFMPGRAADTARNAEDEVAQESDEDANRGGIKCSFSSVGLPIIYPGDLVGVGGFGVFFDGNYLVEGLNHSIAPGDWTMNLKCLTNAPGGPGAINSALVQEWRNPNRNEAPESSDAGGGVSTERGVDGVE